MPINKPLQSAPSENRQHASVASPAEHPVRTNNTLTTIAIIASAFIAASTTTATAAYQQETPDPERARPISPDPWPEREPAADQDDRNLRDLEDSADRRRSSPTVRPTQPGQTRAVGPGVEASLVASFDPSVGVRRPLVPEGTFLANRRGRVAIARTGEHVFIFDKDADGRAEPPMVIAPGTHLTTLETMTVQLPPNARYVVSGQVFVYANVNYIVLAAPPLLELPSAAPSTTPSADRPEQPSQSPQEAASSPDADAIIAELESAVGPARRPIDASTPTPSAAGTAAPLSTIVAGSAQALASTNDTFQRLLPEGALLASRRGRLVRSDQGQWVFAFDTGATNAGRTTSASPNAPAPAATRDRPLIILPCLVLQDMERNAHRLGDSAAMTVSGRVYLYAGRNYLLPTMFRVNRHNNDIASAQ